MHFRCLPRYRDASHFSIVATSNAKGDISQVAERADLPFRPRFAATQSQRLI